MKIIPTTQTAVEKLKRLAKKLRKSANMSLAVALDVVAKEHGYFHWKHVTVCAAQTTSPVKAASLPDSLANLLVKAAAEHPASKESQAAFASGFAFAMDAKDVFAQAIPSQYVECDDAWHIAAMDLWPALIHDHETGTSLAQTASNDTLISLAFEFLENLRFFRFVGTTVPASVDEAYKQTSEVLVFPPTHFWVSGLFIDLSDVPEIKVNGNTLYSTKPSLKVDAAGKLATKYQRFVHLLTDEERVIYETLGTTEREFLLHQAERQTSLGSSRYKPMQSSTDVAWRDAAQG